MSAKPHKHHDPDEPPEAATDHRASRSHGQTPRTFGFLLIPLFPMMGFASATEPLRATNRLSGREL